MQFLNFFDEAFQVSLISHSQPLALTHDLARNTNLTYFVEDTIDFLFQNNKISNLVIFSLKIKKEKRKKKKKEMANEKIHCTELFIVIQSF